MFRVNESNKKMSGLDRMIKRAAYEGYDSADGRNVSGKYKSFQAALKNSYQAEWITLNKGEENEARWRCLINASRLTEQFDKKVISIDFDSGVEEGTVFYWDRTDRYWIINLQQHTEEAYFRGIITRADYTIDVDGEDYWVSVRGPVETTTVWNQKHGIAWNDLNYSMVIQIKKDSRTVPYFTRHKVVKMKLAYPDATTEEHLEEWHNWKVVATDKYSEERVMQIYLKEWYDNEAEDAMISPEEPEQDLMKPHIEGPAMVHAFDENLSYSIVGLGDGKFVVDSSKIKISSSTKTSCVIDVLSSKSMEFTLTFIADDGHVVEQLIKVQSI